MAYDEQLAERVRKKLARRTGVSERKMFGGLAFMLNGNMACGIVKNDLMVRVGPEKYDKLLAEPYARPMDFTGRAMKGMLYIGPRAFRDERTLGLWVRRGADFAASLPKK